MLLARAWSAAEYRDVWWQIAHVVVAWGAVACPFLRARLMDDPARALNVVTAALSYGAEGLVELLPDIDRVGRAADQDLAAAARDTRAWLDGTRGELP